MLLINIPAYPQMEYKAVIDGGSGVQEITDTLCTFSVPLQAHILSDPEIDGVKFEMKDGRRGIIDITDEDRKRFEENLERNHVWWEKNGI